MIKKGIAQIALLKTQHSALIAGYDILDNGLELTHRFKGDEYTLHGKYYSSLNVISNPVKNDPEIKQALDLYLKINQDKKAVYGKAVRSGMFSADELTYLKGIYGHILSAADEDMNELKLLITAGVLQMTDSDRIKGISRVSKNIRQKYRMLTDLNEKVLISLNGRKAQKQQVETLKRLYGQ